MSIRRGSIGCYKNYEIVLAHKVIAIKIRNDVATACGKTFVPRYSNAGMFNTQKMQCSMRQVRSQSGINVIVATVINDYQF